MKLFANENLFEPIIVHLRETGHEVLSIRDAGLSGIPENVFMKISGRRTRAVFDRYNIVNEADLRNASEKVFKLHEETKARINKAHKEILKNGHNRCFRG